MGKCDSGTSVIEARLVSPCASTFAMTRVPALVHADRPLELELASVGLCADPRVAESIASWISAHACLAIAVEFPGQPREVLSLPAIAGPSGSRLILRALVRPSAWADAESVTLVSMSLAGRSLPCDCLPVTLRVGYNHAPAPEKAVYGAAEASHVPALLVALDAGGSTEEADEVRVDLRTGGDAVAQRFPPPLPRKICIPFSAAESFHCLNHSRRQRPPRGPPHAPGGRRQPGCSQHSERG